MLPPTVLGFFLLMADMIAPDRGRIMIHGHVLFDSGRRVNLAARKRRIGYVFQDYALFPHMSVRVNIAFGLAFGSNGARTGQKPAAAGRYLSVSGIHSSPTSPSASRLARSNCSVRQLALPSSIAAVTVLRISP